MIHSGKKLVPSGKELGGILNKDVLNVWNKVKQFNVNKNVNGAGVFVGTTPKPSWLLNHMPFSGWGLGKLL